MTYGLVGKSLGHSYSKLIHEMLGRYRYSLFSIPEESFEEFISAREFDGLNITIPYKKDVIPLCDNITETAKEIGAVNTLYFRGNQLWGTNTDYLGFLYAARSAGISFKDKKVLILGNGGTSLTVRKAVMDQGARCILITTRRGQEGCIPYEELPLHKDVEIIVNTTPVGTYPNNGDSLISLKDFPDCCGVIDVIYNPFATDLLQQAKERGIPHTNGLPMLVAQATAAAEHFLGETGFEKENASIIKAIEKSIENIVLIGMPGCGKSTVGKLMAESAGKTFVDMDAVIEEKAAMSIPEIFSHCGESHFRDLESQVARELGKENGQIIATGGGVVLRPENMKALSQNGSVVFLDRPLEALAMEGRPLSKDAATLKTMYAQRFPLYNKYSQLTQKAGPTAADTAEALLSRLGYIK